MGSSAAGTYSSRSGILRKWDAPELEMSFPSIKTPSTPPVSMVRCQGNVVSSKKYCRLALVAYSRPSTPSAAIMLCSLAIRWFIKLPLSGF